MPEEKTPAEKTPAEKIPEVQKETSQPVEEKQIEEKKEKHWLKPLLLSILGIVLATGLVFGGYKLGQKSASPELAEIPTPTISPEATPSAGVYSISGIDLTIDKALRVEREANDEDLLVLTATFSANEECPLSGGAVCGYDTRWFRLVDDEGFVQDMLFSYPTIKYLTTNPISQRILKLGEKDKGDVFFEITKDKNKFFLTYSSAGETTGKILIEPELFDPTTTWDTYTNSEYKFSFKYPPDWDARDLLSANKTLLGRANTLVYIGFGPEHIREDVYGSVEATKNSLDYEIAQFKKSFESAGTPVIIKQENAIEISGKTGTEIITYNTQAGVESKNWFISYLGYTYKIGGGGTQDNTIVYQVLSTFHFLE